MFLNNFLNKLAQFFKALAPEEMPDVSKMSLQELHEELCHELEFGEYPNEFSREIDRRMSVKGA